MKMQVFECLRCEKEWAREPVRGQRPKFCPECRAESRGNGWRQVECQTCHRPFWVGVSSHARRSCSDECAKALRARGLKPRQQKPLGYYPTREEFERRIEGWPQIVARRDRRRMEAWLHDGRVLVDGECWVWQGAMKDGYPIRTKPWAYVHRQVYMVVYGDIPKGDHVHHVCGRSACVNPDHLALSTARENVGEMLARRAYEARLAHAEDLMSRFAAELPEDHPLVIEWRTTTARGIALSAA